MASKHTPGDIVLIVGNSNGNSHGKHGLILGTEAQVIEWPEDEPKDSGLIMVRGKCDILKQPVRQFVLLKDIKASNQTSTA